MRGLTVPMSSQGVRPHYIRRHVAIVVVAFNGWGEVLRVQSRGHLWDCTASYRPHATDQPKPRLEPTTSPRTNRSHQLRRYDAPVAECLIPGCKLEGYKRAERGV